uniref:B30.2/SPRY domain-containing protein n=1 Tax=Chrysotila carterae TaxID=13221 RepID=A0A7S4BVP7_CHRCT
MSPSMEVSEMAPLPVFRNGVPQNEAMRAHRGTYAIKHLGPHGKNVIVEGRIAKRAEADEIDMSGSMFVEDKCDDLAAVVVGARSAEFGVNTFTFRIERTYSNNGLGTFVGVADSGVDFLNHERWGAAWAIGCHGQNLFSWTDGRGAATLVRGGLPGSDESLPDGATIAVRVDLDARPRVLSFSVDGGPFIVAKGVELPRTVRPFCKLAGFPGDSVALFYQGENSRAASSTTRECACAANSNEQTAAGYNRKLPRESGDTVLSANIA